MAKSESASQKLQAEIERLKSDNEKLEDKALALETKVASKDRYNFWKLAIFYHLPALVKARLFVGQTFSFCPYLTSLEPSSTSNQRKKSLAFASAHEQAISRKVVHTYKPGK